MGSGGGVAGFSGASGASGAAPIAGSGAMPGAASSASSFGGGGGFSSDFMSGLMNKGGGSGGYGQMLGQKTREAALDRLGGGGGAGGGPSASSIEAERQASLKGGPMSGGSAVKAGAAYLHNRRMQALGLEDPGQYLSGGSDLWAEG